MGKRVCVGMEKEREICVFILGMGREIEICVFILVLGSIWSIQRGNVCISMLGTRIEKVYVCIF